MKKTYISPVQKCVELDMQDGIMNPTSDLGIMSTGLDEDDIQLTKEDRKNFNLWDVEW